MKLLFFLLIIIFSNAIHAQNTQTRYIDSNTIVLKMDSLKKVFHLVENAPNDYDVAIYTALEYYSELKGNKIRFKEKRIKTTLNARPTLASLFFKRRSKRVYVVRINNLFDQKEIITLNNVGFNAQVGVFGHEFNHFIDYSQRGFFQILKRGIDYLSTERKVKFEKGIDRGTIERGLGWQCYDWSYYVHHKSNATEEYLKFKREVYLGPEEILILIEQN